MSSVSSADSYDIAALLSPALCANVKVESDSEESSCKNPANQICGGCKLVQYCSRQCQSLSWSRHKKICKSDLNKSRYVPAWIKEDRQPHWVSDSELTTPFGMNQYLWGNMPALDLLNMETHEGSDAIHQDISALFAASGDIRNVVKSVAEGLPDEYCGRCTLVINDLNFMVVARNAILLLVALSLEVEEAAAIMLHVWYSALLPHYVIEKLWKHILSPIDDVCDKIKDKSPHTFQAKTFSFGGSSLRLVLKKHQWVDLKTYFSPPRHMLSYEAQEIRKRCMLAPERIDYLHRALCNQTVPMRVATVTFREDGILLPHGASREEFDIPNPTLFHKERIWPMKDDASPLEGWDYHEYQKFAPKATNDVIGSLFFFLKDILVRFCKRVKMTNIQFILFNVDARELPTHLGTEDFKFDRIELSNICDRGYVGPEQTLSIFSPLLRSKSVNPKATLLMLFLNSVAEVCWHRGQDGPQLKSKASKDLFKKFIPMSPMTMMELVTAGVGKMSSPEMIRVSSCYTMFGDFDEAFDTFLKEVQMRKLATKNDMRIKKDHTIVQSWPLRITENTSQDDFNMLCATSHLGSERYMEFEKR